MARTKEIKRKRRTLILGGLFLLLTGSILFAGFSTLPVTKGDGCANKNFLNIFHTSKPAPYDILSNEVFRFFEKCNLDRDKIVKLLQETGFGLNAHLTDKAAIKNLVSKTAYLNIADFDEYIYVKRGSAPYFWKITTKYQLALYIKNNQIVHVNARATSLELP